MDINPSRGHHRLRIGRHSQAGQTYLLTTVTHQRRPYFLDDEIARRTASYMSLASHWLPGRCLCWVLMPDHWHGLIELGEGARLASVMKRAKGTTARIAGLHDSRIRPLWAKGYHDRAMRRDEAVIDVARYIVANPLRAGLVENILDYPYWDACFMDIDPGLDSLRPTGRD